MAKAIKSAPELPEEVSGPIEEESIIELNGKVDGPIDDKLAELLQDDNSEESATITDESKKTSPKISKFAESGSESKTEVEPEDPKESKVESTEKVTEEDGIVDDEVMDKAIEDIVAAEGDLVLAAEDHDKQAEETFIKKPAKKHGRLKNLFTYIWEKPGLRWVAIFGTLSVLLALVIVPPSRYFILNTARVRASLSLQVVDRGTLQPLKNVKVSAGGASAMTDSDGVAKLDGVKLGRTRLLLEKRAFATQEKTITVGWGSNPLGQWEAKAVGSQYTFFVRDLFSGKPIGKAEASSGEGNAVSDEEGKVVLTLDTASQNDSDQVSVKITADSYREETLNITVNNKETQEVKMVPSKRHVFVTKRGGTYDVFSVDADGKNARSLVKGSGLERDDIVLIPHPTQHYAALVSTRENTRNEGGYLLSTLYIVNTEDGDLMRVDQSERIKIIGWTNGGRLVYVKVAAGASGTDPKRHRLMSFNKSDDTNKELASSNTFNDVILAADKIYYAPSNIFNEEETALREVEADGKNPKTLLDKEVFSIVRIGYDKLRLNAGEEWHEYVLGSPMSAISQSPSTETSRLYIDSPNGSRSLWIDSRDGKGVLIAYEKASKTDVIVQQKGGLRLPAYWLNDKYIVYRVSDGRETADYVINIDGGDARKITDVTDSSGLSRWLYY